jgi:dTDP-glucose 4,6-dehydratase
MAYHRKHRLRTNIARIFNTYGPRMKLDDGRVVPAFLDQALRGEDLTVFGDGSQTRSFCYVSDLVDGLYRLMYSDERYPVNLGNPQEMTIREFAEVIIRLTGSRSSIVSCPLPEDDPKQRRPDICKALRVLGWEPRVTLEEGLRLTIDYFSRKSSPPDAHAGTAETGRM